MAEKGKVLVVDDEPHQRLIMSEACKSMGYDVTIADTGKKALELIRYGNFDVLITDMQMPEMNGIRLLENVMIFDSSVSVILATAHGTIETAVEAMKKGAEDYIL
ncbi:MAG: response regulator, partial [Bdellovibrionota bacterium]